jgi:hypothetical protein
LLERDCGSRLTYNTAQYQIIKISRFEYHFIPLARLPYRIRLLAEQEGNDIVNLESLFPYCHRGRGDLRLSAHWLNPAIVILRSISATQS